MNDKPEFWRRRGRLVGLLSEAAELEHALCCAYLFAAFSMKTHVDEGRITHHQIESVRRWKGSLLFVARQEMEHLAIAANLLTAVGELPYLRRPRFPTGKRFYPAQLALGLHSFSAATVGHFLLFELPAPARDGRELPQVAELRCWLAASPLREDRELAQRMARQRESGVRTIGEIYAEIDQTVQDLGVQDPHALLLGPEHAQVGNEMFAPPGAGPREMYGVSVVKVLSVQDAREAIQKIRHEGEGAPDPNTPMGGHFARFAAIYRELSQLRRDDPRFVPGRRVVRNPVPWSELAVPGSTPVRHPFTIGTMLACDLAYEILMRMLLRFFAQVAPDDADVRPLQEAAFFPMMTAVMRPLGEVLTLLPAHAGGAGSWRAGAAFLSPRRIDFLPHSSAAWRVLHGQLLDLQGRLMELAESNQAPARVRPRLQMAYENVWRIAHNFALAYTSLEQRS
jgi:hypothetical protein